MTNKEYYFDKARFPIVPPDVEDEVLESLRIQIATLSLTSQRNFFAYLMISGKEETYERFLNLWTKDDPIELSHIMPVC